MAPGEQDEDYLSRTEQYWLKLARNHMGPDAKEKKVLKVGHAMVKAFIDDAGQDMARAQHRLSDGFSITGVLKPGVRRPLQRLQSEEELTALTTAVVHTAGRLE